MIRTCLCGKEIVARRNKYCSYSCFRKFYKTNNLTKEKISKAKKGKPSWNKGIKWSEEHKKKLSKAHKESPACQKQCAKLKIFNKGKHRSPKTEFKKGSKPSNFIGRSVHSLGYIWLHSPDHPFKDVRNNVLEHRIVVEKQIKRFLDPSDIVHHINGDRKDNRIENLIAFTSKSSHIRFHKDPSNVKSNEIIFDGSSYLAV